MKQTLNIYKLYIFLIFGALTLFINQTLNLVENRLAFVVILGLIIILSISFGYLYSKIENYKLKIFQMVFENSNDAIALIDEFGNYFWQNSTNKNMLEIDDRELKNHSATFYIANNKIVLKNELEKIGDFSGIFEQETKTGRISLFISAFKITDEFDNVICYVEMKKSAKEYFKILEQIRYEKEGLETLANRDNLTTLFNRNGFFKQLSKISENSLHRGSFVFIDIDNFKKINDSHGHKIGDLVLQNIAINIKEHVRKNDIICRFGGEEFIAFIDAPINLSKPIVEKLREIVELSEVNGLKVTCSFGISGFHNSIEDSIKNADMALYKAKNSGKNRVISFEELENYSSSSSA